MKKSLLLIVALAVMVPGLRADEGRIPLYRPAAIAQPGHYILTRDVAAASGPAVSVVVGTIGHIVIDLNGHTLSTLDASAPVVEINLLPAVQAVIHVRDGSIAGGLHGISLVDAGMDEELALENLSISASASHGIMVDGAASVHVRALGIQSTGLDGIHAENVRNLIGEHVRVSGAAGVGITAGPPGAAWMSVRLIEAHVHLATSHGIQVLGGQEGEDIVLEDCSVVDAGGNGIDAANLGASSPSSVRLQGNHVLRTGGHGVSLHGDYQAQILHNHVADIGLSGDPDVAGYTVWRDNVIVGNTLMGGGGASSHGIRLMSTADGSVIERNNISGFQTGLTMESTGNLVLSNTIHDNTGVGMARPRFPADPGSGSLIARNVVTHNGLDGIRIYAGNLGNLILENQCRGNGGLGLDAGDPSNHYRGNILLGNTGGSVSGGTDAGGNILGP